jgi:micrococcal nuclease
MYRYWATITDVYDGDTVTCDIDLGFGITMHKQKVRLYGINTPELRGESFARGHDSRRFLVEILEKVDFRVELLTHKDKKGKYGRWLAEIYIGNENINIIMVEAGHAVVYMK